MQESKGLLVIISGPSGTGKGTVCKRLLANADNMIHSISVTTRNKREGEVDGIHYFFRSDEEFAAMVESDAFLEHARVYSSNYGTPRQFVLDHLQAGRDVILEIDVQGALNVKKKYPEGILIFILPPSMQELKNRIVGRGTEDKASLEQRFRCAFDELKYINEYDYMVENNVIDQAADKIQAILLAERCRVSRNKDVTAKLLLEENTI